MISRNPWARWTALQPSRQVQIASIVAINGDGTSSVQSLDGASTYRVAGDSVAVGQYALIVEGRVAEQAAALTTVNIEV